jgi:glycosyltransferase involved in cell wall biosynthesis
MHVLYVHQNFPAQFGHIAAHLIQQGWRATFVSLTPPGNVAGIEKIQYTVTGGPTVGTHFCSRTFESTIWHCDGVYRALRARPDIKPDLIVAHAGLGSALFLRELYPDVPVINFFEYYYRTHHAESDMDFRRDLKWPLPDVSYLRSRARNGPLLLELQNCQLGYCPTAFQRSCFPDEYQPKLRVLFDGIDRKIYHGHGDQQRHAGARNVAGVEVPAGTKVVTYVSRGFESMRGFDLFMKIAKRLVDERTDVIVLIVGDDRIVYGGDSSHLGGKTFKQWVLDQDQHDLTRIRFLGLIPPLQLAEILAASDLHIYLTVPFVLSWSMVNAMSCGAVVLGSATPPVREMIADGQNGLLGDFFDVDAFVAKANGVLDDPAGHRPLGRAAEALVAEKYSLDVVLPQMKAMYEEARAITRGLEPPRPLSPESRRQVLGQAKPKSG